MVKNKYYYVWDDEYTGGMIGKCLGNIKYNDERGDSDAILISTFNNENEISKNGWCFKYHNRNYRPATYLEIQWLNECIKLGKFIEQPKNKTYELW